MQTIRLYGTNLTVSRLCMGTVNFGISLDQRQVDEHLDRFLELGGNFVDTAHVYSDWIPGEKSRSEKRLGDWIRRHRRERLVICTKGGHFDPDVPAVSRVTPEQLALDLRESLENLGTDCIDLYMLHRDNPELPVSEIMDCLDLFVREGTVRYLACSNWTAQRTAEANEYARKTGKAPFAVNELLWSMAEPNREALPKDYVVMDPEMLKLGRETHLNFMCFSALAKGYFTRRYAGQPVSEELHRTYDNARNDQELEKLLALDSARDVTHASLRWFAAQPVTAVPIVTFSTTEQLAECAGAFADEGGTGE